MGTTTAACLGLRRATAFPVARLSGPGTAHRSMLATLSRDGWRPAEARRASGLAFGWPRRSRGSAAAPAVSDSRVPRPQHRRRPLHTALWARRRERVSRVVRTVTPSSRSLRWSGRRGSRLVDPDPHVVDRHVPGARRTPPDSRRAGLARSQGSRERRPFADAAGRDVSPTAGSARPRRRRTRNGGCGHTRRGVTSAGRPTMGDRRPRRPLWDAQGQLPGLVARRPAPRSGPLPATGSPWSTDMRTSPSFDRAGRELVHLDAAVAPRREVGVEAREQTHDVGWTAGDVEPALSSQRRAAFVVRMRLVTAGGGC